MLFCLRYKEIGARTHANTHARLRGRVELKNSSLHTKSERGESEGARILRSSSSSSDVAIDAQHEQTSQTQQAQEELDFIHSSLALSLNQRSSHPRYLATSLPRAPWCGGHFLLSVPLLACAWHIVVVVAVVGGAAKAPAARRDMSLLEGAMATTPSSPSSTTTEETPFASIIHSVSFAGTCVEVEVPRAPCAAVVISNVGMHVHTISISRSSYLLSRSRERVCIRANAPMCLCLTRTPASCPTEFDINVGNCLTATYPAFTLDRYSHQFLVRRRRRRRR